MAVVVLQTAASGDRQPERAVGGVVALGAEPGRAVGRHGDLDQTLLTTIAAPPSQKNVFLTTPAASERSISVNVQVSVVPSFQLARTKPPRPRPKSRLALAANPPLIRPSARVAATSTRRCAASV